VNERPTMKRHKRPSRKLVKTFLVLCEGNTEYNYFKGINDNLPIKLKPINLKGGGYKTFLEELKKTSNSNYLAKFIILDLDVLINNPNEKHNFDCLFQYCQNENKSKRIPTFLIINNPDFEYIACCHNPKFRGSNYKNFITTQFKYQDIDKFKKDTNIYNVLTTKGNSIPEMLKKLNRNKYIQNKFIYNKVKKDIFITKTHLNLNNSSIMGSNINEFFELMENI
jgi:hypothetical protein